MNFYLIKIAYPCFFISLLLLSNVTFSQRLILFGKGHPIYQHDDKYFSILSRKVSEQLGNGAVIDSFKSGSELIAKLKAFTKKHSELSDVFIICHSNENGFYVSHNIGFYKNPQHFPVKGGKVLLFSTIDLKKCVQDGSIHFADSAKVFLLGCRTSYGSNSIAAAFCQASQRDVLGFDSKVDMYNVVTKGLDIKIEGDASLKYYSSKLKGGMKFSLDSSKISFSDLYAISKIARQ